MLQFFRTINLPQNYQTNMFKTIEHNIRYLIYNAEDGRECSTL